MTHAPTSFEALSAVNTDADALVHIVHWSHDRYGWQRQALYQLSRTEALNDEQLNNLFQLALHGGEPTSPLTPEHVKSSSSVDE